VLRGRLSYANVVATLALFIALGGSSYAAIKITGKNVKDASLTSADVKDRSLLSKDFKAGQLPAGPQGSQGAQGAAGATGATGSPGASAAGGGAVTYHDATVQNPASAFTEGSVGCGPGEQVVGGGIKVVDPSSQYIVDSAPDGTSGWAGTVNGGVSNSTFTVTAICRGP
jgi:hypothetical protein